MARETKLGPSARVTSRSFDYAAESAPVISYDASVASAAVIPKGTYRVVATTACWWTEAASPTATVGAGSAYLAAGVPEYIQFKGDTKVAAIKHTGGTAGILSFLKVD